MNNPVGLKQFILLFFFLTLPSGSHAFGNDTLFLDLDYSLQGVKWGINKDNEYPALKYKTEGLTVMRLGGSLGFDHEAILAYHVERPVMNNAHQREMLATNTAKTSGLASTVGIFNLAPIVSLLLPEECLATILVKKALSLRIKQTKELYFNEATARTDVTYLPENVVFDYDQRTVSGTQTIAAGQKFSSKSHVEETEITIPIVSTDVVHYANGERVKVSRHDLRLGYYQREWNRPTDTSGFTVNNKPIAYEATYRSKGVAISIEPSDPGAAGINGDFSCKLGYKDSIQSPLDWGKISRKDVDTTFIAISFGLWYNLYFEPSLKGWSVTLGGNWSKTAMNVDVFLDEAHKDSKTLVHDDDKFVRYYLRTAYRF